MSILSRLAALFGLLLLVGCQPASPTLPVSPALSPTSELSATNPPPITPTAPVTAVPDQPTATTTPPAAQTIYLADSLPQGLREAFGYPASYTLTSDPAAADIHLEVWSPESATVQSITWWTYALVAPFPTIPGNITAQALRRAWIGEAVEPFAGVPLLMEAETLTVLSTWWGEPAAQAVQVLPAASILETAWENQPGWAIVPFEALEPRWKVLTIDGVSPLLRDFDPQAYALSVPYVLTTPPGLYDWSLPPGNRDASRLSVVDLTGVTALVRGTALWMERYGITYPAQNVGSLLSGADLTHISNEIPFTTDCPYPELHPTGMVFCSNPAYIELLNTIGADIIELTGDHFADWGPEALYYTLSLYEDNNMQVYGGGINAEQARRPLLVEHNGNRLAFLGCNIGCQVKPQVPCDAIADAERPGAALCDFDWLQGEISDLTSQGYQVLFTFQHREEYTYTATPILVEDFGRVAQMGATIVSGSQAHQAHGFAFDSGAFIHYGLGNLFFDQYHFCADYACDYAFIDRHIFYAGRHISTELIPIRFVDLARPRLMTPEESARFLEIIFTTSGW